MRRCYLALLAVSLLCTQLHSQQAFAANGKTFYKAVVVGVSHYQDAEIPDLKFAHRDAEAFAALLQSPSGGGMQPHQLRLLTNDQATAARFVAALDWLFEQPLQAGQRVLVYFAGYGGVLPQSTDFPGYLLLNDSPMSPLSAGAFEFQAFFKSNMMPWKPNCTIITNTYPLVLPQDMAASYPFRNYQPKEKSISPVGVKNTVTSGTFEASFDEISRSKISLNNLLLDGLLGLADRNGNGEVTARELTHFLKNQQAAPEAWPSQLAIATEQKDEVLAYVDEKLITELSKHEDGVFPSIIHLETTRREDALLATVDEPVRHHYQDFVVAVKLGHLLEPQGRSAASLYDTLLKVQALQPLWGDIRRKLAAALQDETQQALNAYLRTDSREIIHRNKDERYRLYPQYLSLSLQLLGEKHYLRDILLAKQRYFEGLQYRFEAEVSHDTSLLELALQKQADALFHMPDAAFIINEMGVIYGQMGRLHEAIEQFKVAAELSPNWSIPESNLCFSLTLSGSHAAAIEHGKQAVRLSPRNVLAFNNLGLAWSKSGNEVDAEKAFVRAISLDDYYTETYYNLACLKARQGQHDLALEWLEQALKKGFHDAEQLKSEADLVATRQLPRFNQLMEKYLDSK